MNLPLTMRKQHFRVMIIIILVACVCFFTYLTHQVTESHTAVTHLYYIPIFIAALWWQKNGLIVSICLSVYLLSQYYIYSVNSFHIYLRDDLFRVFMFLSIGYVVAIMSERIAKSEQTAKANEIKYRAIFDNIYSCVAICTPVHHGETYKIADINVAAEELDQIKREDIIGKNFETVYPQVKESGLLLAIRKVMVSGIPQYYNVVKKKNGRIVKWHKHYVFKLTTGDIVIVYTDQTLRRVAEQRVRESEEKSWAVVKQFPMGISLSDEKGHVKYLNPKFVEMFGYNLNDFQSGSEWFQKMFPDKECRDKIISTWVSDYKTGEGCSTEDQKCKVTCKDGTLKNVIFRPIIIEDGGTFVVFEDCTEKEQIQAHLLETEKMASIGTLAGGIAHDFNNILFPIVGYAQMLLDDLPEDSPLRNRALGIYTGAMRARDLVRQIVTFSRTDSLTPQLMSMQPVVKEALKLIRSTIPTSIEIKQNIEKNCGVIKADPTQIHRVVMNLATNAFHAMEEKGGELSVGLKNIELCEKDANILKIEPGSYVCLTVADTGVGIEKALINKIFNPFFTTKEKGRGTGMGLSVIHGIVGRAGGSIQVDSEPGKGTEFLIYLPVVKSRDIQKKMLQKQPAQTGNESILLVDDEEEILAMEKEMLERLGYRVVAKVNAIEALMTFREIPDKFDIVITDMAMPNMSGDKLVSEIRKIRSDIPILCCTGFSEKLSKQKAADERNVNFMIKPMIKEDLARMIRELLDTRKAA